MIEQLNTQARMLVAQGEDPYQAVRTVARQAGLIQIEDDGQCCILYETPTGQLINLWAYPSYGVADAVVEGGLGFDDQIEWYTQREVAE